MANRGRRGSFRGRRQDRKRIWSRELQSFPGPTSGQSLMGADFATELGYVGGRFPPGSTIGGARIRISLVVEGGEMGANAAFMWGLIVDEADVQTEVPRPLADRHADWLYWDNVAQVANQGVGTTLEIAGDGQGALHVRSMRKIEEIHDRLWFSWELNNSGAGEATVTMACSTLILLP